ncbi:MAG TPA: NAD(P)H-hydrate dehydratase [Candidatus Thermoplasmatota archaeon]|nr:NAD(P)H-hydrate dehydratase [Candidatus Thermoplasmatota archaeon]
MLHPEDVAILDRNAAALGVPTARLMENAGRAVADHVASGVDRALVTVLAGPGNNGGDGIVAARHLVERGFPVRVVTPVAGGAFKTALARDAFTALPPRVEVRTVSSPEEAEWALAGAGVIVDALFGVGFHGEMREPYRTLALAANRSRARVVSVDVPSGFGTPVAVQPDETVTFHDVKVGMTEQNSGRIVVRDIGIPPEALTHTGPGEFLLYPIPPRDQHKGQGGIVLVIGGGPYTGAPAVAGLAALRMGADLAIVLTPKRAADVVAAYSPNLVVRPLNNDELDFDDPANRVTLNMWLKKADALVIGPGLGLMNLTKRSIHHAVERALKEGVPVVADADALTALAERPHLLAPGMVVTPHAREFQALTGNSLPGETAARAGAAKHAAAKTRATWLVKGPVDVIADPERGVKLNATGHPAMSVGGTGDALAGMVGALLAKGLSPFDAARLAAYASGRAGEKAFEEKSYGLLATDVVEAIPRVLRDHLA